MDFVWMSDKAVREELGARLRRQRLNQNMTQTALARKAGVARSVIQNLEQGRDCALSSVISTIRGLGALDQLDLFIPDPGISPVQLARLQGQTRRRASGQRGASRNARG